MLGYAGRRLSRRFIVSTQTPGTQIKPFLLAIYIKGRRVNVRHPAALGMTFGMTHIMTELGRFAT